MAPVGFLESAVKKFQKLENKKLIIPKTPNPKFRKDKSKNTLNISSQGCKDC